MMRCFLEKSMKGSRVNIEFRKMRREATEELCVVISGFAVAHSWRLTVDLNNS